MLKSLSHSSVDCRRFGPCSQSDRQRSARRVTKKSHFENISFELHFEHRPVHLYVAVWGIDNNYSIAGNIGNASPQWSTVETTTASN